MNDYGYTNSFNFYVIDSIETVKKKQTNKMIPDALPDIWITKKDELFYSSNDIDYKKLPKDFIWGLYDTYSYIKSNSSTRVLSIKFFPFAVAYLFNKDLLPIRNSYSELNGFLGENDFSNYLETIDLSDIDRAILEIEEHLILQLQNKEWKPTTRLIRKALKRIEETKGSTTIMELAGFLSVSRQHLTKTFKRMTGLTIKEYITVFRIRLCVDFELDEGSDSLTVLSYMFGFFDQAHFIKQFKRIVGESPRSYFKKKHQIKQHMR